MPFGEALKPKWSHTEKPCVGKGKTLPFLATPTFSFSLIRDERATEKWKDGRSYMPVGHWCVSPGGVLVD